MPIPVIDPTQSIPEYLQGQAGAFQPAATYEPTAWRVAGLPPGWTIDDDTGLCSGTATLPGPYNFRVWASNADGESAPVDFCMGVEASAASTGVDLDLVWELTTNEVRLGIPPLLPSATNAAATQPGSVEAIAAATTGKARRLAALAAAITNLKFGSDWIIRPRLTKLGAPIVVAATKFGWSFKEFDTDGVIEESDAFILSGSGAATIYRVYGKLDNALLAAELSNQQAPYGTRMAVRCALYVEWTNADHSATVTFPSSGTPFGGTTLRIESSPFYVAIDALQKP